MRALQGKPHHCSALCSWQAQHTLALPSAPGLLKMQHCSAGWARAAPRPLSVPSLQTGQEGAPSKYRPDSLSSIPPKGIQQLVLEAIPKHEEEKKSMRSSERGSLMLEQSASCSAGVSSWGDEGRAVGGIYPDLSTAMDAASPNSLPAKLRKCGSAERQGAGGELAAGQSSEGWEQWCRV